VLFYKKCKIMADTQLLEHYRLAATSQMLCAEIKSIHFSINKDMLSQKSLLIIQSAKADRSYVPSQPE
jgi:hypothetical protein